jgi:hypothetical protein
MSMDRDHPDEAGLGKDAANFVPVSPMGFLRRISRDVRPAGSRRTLRGRHRRNRAAELAKSVAWLGEGCVN